MKDEELRQLRELAKLSFDGVK